MCYNGYNIKITIDLAEKVSLMGWCFWLKPKGPSKNDSGITIHLCVNETQILQASQKLTPN